MTLLQSKLPVQSIHIHLEYDSKEEVIERLCKTCSVAPHDDLFNAIMNREKEIATYIGDFCAIPHAHIDSLKETVVTCASLSRPVTWDDIGDEVILVFLLAGPPANAAVHLRLLSQLARMLHNREIRNRLIDATTPQEFHSCLFSKEE